MLWRLEKDGSPSRARGAPARHRLKAPRRARGVLVFLEGASVWAWTGGPALFEAAGFTPAAPRPRGEPRRRKTP
jgi:hypothetical protein